MNSQLKKVFKIIISSKNEPSLIGAMIGFVLLERDDSFLEKISHPDINLEVYKSLAISFLIKYIKSNLLKIDLDAFIELFSIDKIYQFGVNEEKKIERKIEYPFNNFEEPKIPDYNIDSMNEYDKKNGPYMFGKK